MCNQQNAGSGTSPSLAAPSYRDAMAKVGAAVNVVTTNGPGGRAGFTASAVCSVTDTPPMLLVCVNRSSSVYRAFALNGVLAVNALAPSQEHLSKLFGGKTPADERFAAGSWRVGQVGVPILRDAVVSFECAVRSVTQVGTHEVMFCEVLDVAIGESEHALLYCSRKYHAVPC